MALNGSISTNGNSSRAALGGRESASASPIGEVLCELESAIAMLEQDVAALHSRLMPVIGGDLQPGDHMDGANAKPVQPRQSQLAAGLMGLDGRVRAQLAKLRAMTRQLEV